MIRILFLFFLLLNAAYFYTQFDDTGEPASSTILKQPPLPQGVATLVLLRERGLGGGDVSLSEKKTDKSSVQAVASKPSVKSIDILSPSEAQRKEKPRESREPTCFTLGPFARNDVAKRSTKALTALGVDVKHREVSQRTPRGHWVYLPASKSYQAARRKVKELQKKGLKDLYIMGKGSHENAISLGLFTRESAANSRFRQVKKLGLKAVLETQYRVNQQIWLDLAVPGNRTSAVASIVTMADSLKGVELGQRRCP
ncbi:MAG TPA: hypothetical protein ENK04_05565 [Gammaproteobacteria bacterium]|nr:hypothetical protein [Gammaproteobacteria bacterium]